MLAGAVSVRQFPGLINWDVLFIFTGMAVLVELLTYSEVPKVMVEKILEIIPNPAIIILVLSILSGLISMVMENVATFLLMVPLVLSFSRRIENFPVGATLAAVAFASNLQGSATLIGDPPSMILGQFARLGFNDFFFYQNKPGIFFMVEIAALASFLYIFFYFRGYSQRLPPPAEPPVQKNTVVSFFPAGLLLGLILTLALVKKPAFSVGQWCLLFAGIGLGWFVFRGHIKKTTRPLLALDGETLFFLAGVFILVGVVKNYGWIEYLANSLSRIGWLGTKKFLVFNFIVWFSVLVSGFVDNVPYIVAGLPLVEILSKNFAGSEMFFYYGLLLGATGGGNITPFGSTTGIVAYSLIQKQDQKFGWKDFLKFGFLFSIISVLAGEVFLLLFWY